VSASILVVDDDGPLLSLLTRFFEKRGHTVFAAATGARALASFEEDRPDLVLLDLDLPDISGIPVLQRLRQQDEDVVVIMLTGHGDIETAVEAMRSGAENFLTKPLELEHLAAAVDRAAEKARLKQRNRALSRAVANGGQPPGTAALGGSTLMRKIGDQVDRIARSHGTILLQGETGTGKGWLARRVHELSDRADAPFIEVNCAGLSATFLDSELFGHEQGAFTDAKTRKSGLLEVAHGGTLLLDEIGDLAPELQPKLLKVLETRRFRRLGGTRELTTDVRLIAATNRDLEQLVDLGQFRQDLYFRLAVLPLELPPLRERDPDDIVDLAYAILEELRRDVGHGPRRIHDQALQRLTQHPWPGNIRQLRNVLERILILSTDDDEIRLHHLPPEVGLAPEAPHLDQAMTLKEMERRAIVVALERNDGNRSRTARQLGISRAALYDKLERYRLHDVGR
jgi:DNA-binding NtrC family response regulator